VVEDALEAGLRVRPAAYGINLRDLEQLARVRQFHLDIVTARVGHG
jgi:hypothetical protein